MVTGFNHTELRNAVADGPVIRIVIADHAGSAPRETGTAMLVGENSQQGTIGGGALEFKAVKTAREMLNRHTETQILTIPLGPDLGQCCGGSVTLVLEHFTQETLPDATNTIFARPVSGAERRPLSVRRALTNMRNLQAPKSLVFTDGWLAEAGQEASRPLWLYGAGHVGRAIVDTLQGLPFHVTWIDTHKNRFPSRIPPNATALITQNPALVVQNAPDNAQHIVLTYSHSFDLEICHQVLSRNFVTLGVIGSPTKRARFVRRLRQLGHSPENTARMICPIGNRALGKNPKAIAVGVVADLLSLSAAVPIRKEATQ